MFRALLCPSSGARDYNVDYHIGLSFCKDGRGSVNLKLWFLVVCVFGVELFVVWLWLVTCL